MALIVERCSGERLMMSLVIQPMTGSDSAPVAVTKDPSHKTQPAWSPDGRQMAFTVWSYESQFWRRQ